MKFRLVASAAVIAILAALAYFFGPGTNASSPRSQSGGSSDDAFRIKAQ